MCTGRIARRLFPLENIQRDQESTMAGKVVWQQTLRADIHVTTAALRGISVYCRLENPLSFRNTAPPSQWLSRQKPDTFSVICVDCTNFPFLFSFSNFFPSSLCRRASQGLLSGALITGVPNRVT